MANSVWISWFGAVKVTNNGSTVEWQGNIATTGQFLAANGSMSAPSYAFGSEPELGFYRASTGLLAFADGGQDRIYFAENRIDGLNDAFSIRFGAIVDVVLTRGAANRLDLAINDSFNVRGGTGAYMFNGVSGFTGTGSYTNFTIAGGIITAAS